MSKQSVVLLCPSYSRGLQDYTHNLASGLVDTDIEFVVYTNHEFTHLAETPNAVPVFGATPVEDVVSLVGLLRSTLPDIVHSQSTNVGLLSVLLALRPMFDYRLVLTPHSSTSNWDRLVYDRVQTTILRCTDGLIWHTEQDLGTIDGDEPPQTVIEHGNYSFYAESSNVDRTTAREQLGIPEDDIVFLFFGYIRTNKRLDLLIDAFASLPDDLQNSASLVIAGQPVADDGSAEPDSFDAYRRQIRATGIGADVYASPEFVLDELVPVYFTAADAIVTPYDSISDSGVAHIAFAFSRPVIASDVGGFAERIEDGEHGYLFEPGSAEALRDVLANAIRDPATLESIGERNGALAAENDWRSVARATVAFYDRICPEDR